MFKPRVIVAPLWPSCSLDHLELNEMWWGWNKGADNPGLGREEQSVPLGDFCPRTISWFCTGIQYNNIIQLWADCPPPGVRFGCNLLFAHCQLGVMKLFNETPVVSDPLVCAVNTYGHSVADSKIAPACKPVLILIILIVASITFVLSIYITVISILSIRSAGGMRHVFLHQSHVRRRSPSFLALE
ncbi:unnamed protein product [Pleuronectes platessa]|uniref:Uncharacterized protein n=1 Tax=Pleuronectes platessa TaxID=8262 RepID=A0A9N7U7R6_PLEPL|nr:unnamed protein product [Pleuronectes platessa]